MSNVSNDYSNKYLQDVYDHVNQKLDEALNAEPVKTNIIRKCEEIPGYRDYLVESIVRYSLQPLSISYKSHLDETVRRTIYDRRIKEFLHPANLVNLAMHFDKIASAEEQVSMSR